MTFCTYYGNRLDLIVRRMETRVGVLLEVYVRTITLTMIKFSCLVFDDNDKLISDLKKNSALRLFSIESRNRVICGITIMDGRPDRRNFRAVYLAILLSGVVISSHVIVYRVYPGYIWVRIGLLVKINKLMLFRSYAGID